MLFTKKYMNLVAMAALTTALGCGKGDNGSYKYTPEPQPSVDPAPKNGFVFSTCKHNSDNTCTDTSRLKEYGVIVLPEVDLDLMRRGESMCESNSTYSKDSCDRTGATGYCVSRTQPFYAQSSKGKRITLSTQSITVYKADHSDPKNHCATLGGHFSSVK